MNKDSRPGLGRFGEGLAERYLAGKGYAVVGRNWRCPRGELDIIARDGGTLVFVEVRTRRGAAFGSPEESITDVKKARLIETARAYLQESGCAEDTPWRIDVVGVEVTRGGKVSEIRHIPNAVNLW